MRLLLPAICLALAMPLGAATVKRVDPQPKTVRSEPRATLAVKDAEVRDVLDSLKKQCGVKNLVIDPGVGGKVGSLFVKDIPCSAAFRLVLRMSGLDAKVYQNSLIHVGAAKR